MMKHFSIITTLSVLIISSPLRAMDQPTIPFHYEYTLPNNSRCYSVTFSKDKLFIAGENGVTIYNNTTKTLTKLCDEQTFQIAAHPTIPHVALSTKTELAIYDTKTEKKIWTHGPINQWILTSISFSPTNHHTVYAYCKGLLTPYHPTESLQLFRIPCDTHSIEANKIMWHPTKHEFLYPSSKQTISVVEPNNSYKTRDNITFPNNNNICMGQYSHDASTIAIKDSYKKCCLYDLTNNSFHHLIASKYHSIAFHPNKNILALLTTNGAIHYLNSKTKNIIAVTRNFHNDHSTRKLFSRTKRLDFSPDGKYLAVGLANTCLVVPAPINNLVMMYFMLKNYTNEDITQYTAHILPNALELEELNFLELLNT